MHTGKTLFAQLMDFLPRTTFTRIVNHCSGDYKVRTLRCTEHYRVRAFAQLAYRESLRDIEACLSAQPAKLYLKLPLQSRQVKTSPDFSQLRPQMGFWSWCRG